MSIKEKPLIRAVERLGPLPGFLFSHPIFAGFISMVMCAFFGAATMMFWAAFGTTSQIYEAMRIGAIVLTVFGAMIFIGIFFNAFRDRDETANRLQFVLGGVLGLGFLFAFDFFTAEYLREYFDGGGLLICTSQVAGCN